MIWRRFRNFPSARPRARWCSSAKWPTCARNLANWNFAAMILALWITHTSLNIISFLGAIIGIGIVAKNGILMLDYVEHLRNEGATLHEALVRSGRRRLRPVLMTSLAAALGMLPLAYGIGSGADTLRPLAIAVIGALCFSVLLSLVATPVFYYLMAPAGTISTGSGGTT